MRSTQSLIVVLSVVILMTPAQTGKETNMSTWYENSESDAPSTPAPSPSSQPPPPKSPGARATAALVLGIASIVVFPILVSPFGVLAIVLGAKDRRENRRAFAGWMCGIIGLSLSVALMVFVFAVSDGP